MVAVAVAVAAVAAPLCSFCASNMHPSPLTVNTHTIEQA